MHVSKQVIQRVLGALWLLDGLLQLQPFMFGPGFANSIIAPTGDGQPSFVSGPVRFAAHVVGAQPALLNAMFAAVQILIGLGLLIPRITRLALASSIAWALGVWWLGEGFGGIASAHATVVTGAPGAVILYAVLAAAAWPATRSGRDDVGALPAGWLPLAWALLWIGGAVLQVLPAQRRGGDLAAQLADNADGAPGWLAATDRAASHLATAGGAALITVLATAMATIGGIALVSGTARRAATIAGISLALVFWITAQNLGGLYTGEATDPNTGPLLVLLGFAVASTAPRRLRSPTPAYARRSSHPQRASLPARG